MSSFDFHAFVPRKKHLKRKLFNSGDELKNAVKYWVSLRSQEFWEQEILWLVNQWDRCDHAYGYNFEVVDSLTDLDPEINNRNYCTTEIQKRTTMAHT
ncbi:hypothetical protein TNCV_2128401 [Trichonephila clavipes]|nr:hypothetical protein TNCV_2128401 [Trichonephila clavipes]